MVDIVESSVRMQTEDFILKDCTVVCSECKSLFATRILQDLPPVHESDIIEADLHRVLPDPGLRGALIAVCPYCQYAAWAGSFTGSLIRPDILLPQTQWQSSRKFALAVKHARNKGLHPLNTAYIALNGLYCARESGESDDSWLELCVYEQSRGLQSNEITGESAVDHLVMAELWRQISSFERAIAEYKRAAAYNTLPEDLIRHQIMLSQASVYSPT